MLFRTTFSVLTLSLAACAPPVVMNDIAPAAETVSDVSKTSVSPAGYKKIAIFLERLNDDERPAAEQIFITKLNAAGPIGRAGKDVFGGRDDLTEAQKASVLQTQFDGVLYITVLQKSVEEKILPGAQHNGQVIDFISQAKVGHATWINVKKLEVSDPAARGYILKADGTVWQPLLVLKVKVDFQDTRSAKLVWTSQSSASGDASLTNVSALLRDVSDQIVEKMKVDRLINPPRG